MCVYVSFTAAYVQETSKSRPPYSLFIYYLFILLVFYGIHKDIPLIQRRPALWWMETWRGLRKPTAIRRLMQASLIEGKTLIECKSAIPKLWQGLHFSDTLTLEKPVEYIYWVSGYIHAGLIMTFRFPGAWSLSAWADEQNVSLRVIKYSCHIPEYITVPGTANGIKWRFVSFTPIIWISTGSSYYFHI